MGVHRPLRPGKRRLYHRPKLAPRPMGRESIVRELQRPRARPVGHALLRGPCPPAWAISRPGPGAQRLPCHPGRDCSSSALSCQPGTQAAHRTQAWRAGSSGRDRPGWNDALRGRETSVAAGAMGPKRLLGFQMELKQQARRLLGTDRVPDNEQCGPRATSWMGVLCGGHSTGGVRDMATSQRNTSRVLGRGEGAIGVLGARWAFGQHHDCA